MLGFSLYFENETDFEKQIEKFKGFDLLFTSLHYPASDETYDKFLTLLDVAKDIKICVDINNQTLKDHPDLLDKNLIIRLDFGFSPREIASLSKECQIAINASTVNYKFLEDLAKAGANMANMIAIHNYYPLVFSGLSQEYFLSQNELINSFGIRIAAFVQGNTNLRGPVFRGLPTLEEDRNQDPYLSLVKLKRKYKVDDLILAEDVDEYSKNYILKFINDGIISLPIIWENDYEYLSKIKVRNDISDYIIRNEREKKDVSPDKPRPIKRGDLVVLNNLSGRYGGEIEIVKKDLGLCDDRNLIGRVDEAYIDILDLIEGGDIVDFDRR